MPPWLCGPFSLSVGERRAKHTKRARCGVGGVRVHCGVGGVARVALPRRFGGLSACAAAVWRVTGRRRRSGDAGQRTDDADVPRGKGASIDDVEDNVDEDEEEDEDADEDDEEEEDNEDADEKEEDEDEEDEEDYADEDADNEDEDDEDE